MGNKNLNSEKKYESTAQNCASADLICNHTTTSYCECMHAYFDDVCTCIKLLKLANVSTDSCGC